MCSTCGCGTDQVRVTDLDHLHAHEHGIAHEHAEVHSHGEAHDLGAHDHGAHDHEHTAPDRTHTVELEQAVLARNDSLAAEVRTWLAERRITALNMMSSPGSGKTTLLEHTIAGSSRKISVIEGDQETLFDARRIRAAGARAVQVNTGAGCHLDASMVQRALTELQPEPEGVVFIENVGNLVCPALFDLGEYARVVVISVPEGDDKPLKYPHMFAAADLVVVNKIDLLPYVDFDIDRLTQDARRLKPEVEVLCVSARTGENLDQWRRWIDAADARP